MKRHLIPAVLLFFVLAACGNVEEVENPPKLRQFGRSDPERNSQCYCQSKSDTELPGKQSANYRNRWS